MRSNTLLLSFGLLTGAIAADKVVTMYIPDGDDSQALAGKIIGSASDTTTYQITCADSVTTSCDVPAGATVIQGPSTANLLAVESGHTATLDCTHNDKIATCSQGYDGEWLETTTETVTSYKVTITATETGSSSTPASASASATSTTTTESASSSTADADSTGADATTTGADAQETDDGDNGAVRLASGVGLGAALMAVGAAAVALF
ncbi:hypothetical protein BJY00DRAFT_319218 [Aspergillus carlsbadensis]|nr:hypothetical protein BJY00DRAFT_319218 [Aspergillus carlsbadensis]